MADATGEGEQPPLRVQSFSELIWRIRAYSSPQVPVIVIQPSRPGGRPSEEPAQLGEDSLLTLGPGFSRDPPGTPSVRVFLSYASAQRPLAERINYLLQSEGHSVFFDHEDLPAGDTYGERIRSAVEDCELFVFLVSPESVSAGSYALTELTFAERVPARRAPGIIPVLAAPISSIEQLPPFLAPLTLLEPRGDAAAEVAARVAEVARRRMRRRSLQGAAVAAVAGLIIATVLVLRQGAPPTPPPLPDTVAEKRPQISEPERVRLIGMPTNSGWTVTFDIADRQVREIFYALDDEQTFVSTGFQPSRNPETGLPLPQQWIQLPGARGQKRDLSVKYIDGEGRERGPYRLQFDPRAEYVRSTKSALGMTDWPAFREYPRGRLLVYFTHLISYKNALREIRYSVDDESLAHTVPFSTDWPGRGSPGILDSDLIHVEIPTSAKFFAVKLYFIDGTESELKRFPISEFMIE
jgi:TIR domain